MFGSTTRFSFAARYSAIPEYVSAVVAALPVSLRTDLVRAGLAEALGNAVLHGAFGLDPSVRDAGDVESWLDAIDQAERSPRVLDRVIVAVRARSTRCVVRVSDPGLGFDWRHALERDGHGLAVLHEAFASVRWNDAGNAVSLTLRTQRDAPEESTP